MAPEISAPIIPHSSVADRAAVRESEARLQVTTAIPVLKSLLRIIAAVAVLTHECLAAQATVLLGNLTADRAVLRELHP